MKNKTEREIAETTSDAITLTNLAQSKDAGVRFEVASSSSTPEEIRDQLKLDPVESVANAAKSNNRHSEQSFVENSTIQQMNFKLDETPELSLLYQRANYFLTTAVLTLFAGFITLLVSSYSLSLYSEPNLGHLIGMILGVILLSCAGIAAVAWLFTSSLSLHASATVRAITKQK